MKENVEATRQQMLQLLEATRRETRLALSNVDFEGVIYNEQPAWRVRDIIGHVGVWNNEAVRSLRAYFGGGEYHCIPSEEEYDEYNLAAVEERRTWDAEQVWGEYESANDQLKELVESIPPERWTGELLYPWNDRGTIQYLIEVMMQHEVEHRESIVTTIM
jgi:hypothetical protein